MVCKGWSERLAWLGAGEPGSEKLRHALLSVHSRLENINVPFTQVRAGACLPGRTSWAALYDSPFKDWQVDWLFCMCAS